ncbi:cupin domain-containing protein [Paraflavitalea sp. CAU 1676]|uniref:cupin domain-containing protein n=1 Tax=Paraflavitalea sp. CAU 1676 TaxID=3032598 RepID=UPI0023DA13A6|nr:cupin domain-containing protein [Paraflavitalea sp. CAU 1676]MDF2193441.1 cupin domain-containing protein [Paraflavitalea sp. CAU 1676]
MNRNSFLRAGLAIAAFLSVPFGGLAGDKYGKKVGKGFKVDAGKDRHGKSLSLFEGDTFYCKVSSEDTDGGMYMFESTRIKEGGPILHTHYDTDEWWYVLQGEFLIKVGDTTYNAKAGDFVYGPRMVPHTFAKVGTGEAKVLILHQPAGKMEEYFKKLSEGVAANMSEEQRNNMRKEHGFEKVGPPLTYLKQ